MNKDKWQLVTDSQIHREAMQLFTKKLYSNFNLSVAFLGGMLLVAVPAHASSSVAEPRLIKMAMNGADLRLELDKINLDANTGNLDDAIDEIEQLKQTHPDDPDVLDAETSLFLSQQNRGMAYAAAQGLDTPNAADRQREALSLPPHASVAVGYDFSSTSEAYEQIENLDSQMAVAQGTGLSLKLSNEHVNTREPFTRSKGLSQSFYGNRQQGSVSVDKMFADGQEVVGTVYAQQNKIGGGVQYSLWDRWGATSLIGEYNRPVIDYVEMIVEHGVKRDVHLERKLIFNENLQVTATGGFSSYALDGVNDAADAPGWGVNADYTNPVNLFNGEQTENGRGDVTLGAHYNASAEYFTYVNRRANSSGNLFTPLRASTYEAHVFTASASKNLLDNVTAALAGGYGINRLQHTSGPVFSAGIDYTMTPDVAVNVHATRTLLGGQNNREREDDLGANLKIAF